MPTFETRSFPVAPGGERVYDEADWRDAIVFVESGEIELDSLRGATLRFRRGDMLWLSGLPIRALCNRGRKAAVLVAVSRADEFLGDGRSEET